VNGFPDTPADGSNLHANDIYLKNIKVKYHQGRINEIPALVGGPGAFGSAQNDPVGSLFQTMNRDQDENLVTINEEGRYIGNPLTNVQACVAKAHNAGLFHGETHLDLARQKISPQSVDWVEGKDDAEGNHYTLHSKLKDANGVMTNFRLGTYSFNGDSMFHVNKGVIGFKLDGGNRIVCIECTVYGLSSSGKQGFTHQTLPVPLYTTDINNPEAQEVIDRDQRYKNRKQLKSHPAATYPGYNGAAGRGFSMASSSNVYLLRPRVVNSKSHHGAFTAYDVHRHSKNVYIRDGRSMRNFAGTNGCFGDTTIVSGEGEEQYNTCKSCAFRRGPKDSAKDYSEIKNLKVNQRTWDALTYQTSDEQSTSSEPVELITGINPRSFDMKSVLVFDHKNRVIGCGELQPQGKFDRFGL
jgi:hypothetical protein